MTTDERVLPVDDDADGAASEDDGGADEEAPPRTRLEVVLGWVFAVIAFLSGTTVVLIGIFNAHDALVLLGDWVVPPGPAVLVVALAGLPAALLALSLLRRPGSPRAPWERGIRIGVGIFLALLIPTVGFVPFFLAWAIADFGIPMGVVTALIVLFVVTAVVATRVRQVVVRSVARALVAVVVAAGVVLAALVVGAMCLAAPGELTTTTSHAGCTAVVRGERTGLFLSYVSDVTIYVRPAGSLLATEALSSPMSERAFGVDVDFDAEGARVRFDDGKGGVDTRLRCG